MLKQLLAVVGLVLVVGCGDHNSQSITDPLALKPSFTTRGCFASADDGTEIMACRLQAIKQERDAR